MQIAPLCFIPKQAASPHRVMNHHDSLIFSITSQKYNSRKQTLLLDESKQINQQKVEPTYNDYFTIHDKIKLLEEKVQNIKTNYCESQKKSDTKRQSQNQPRIANMQFPQEIYVQKCFIKDQKNEVGKIKRKKQKPYFVVQQKSRTKSRSHTKNEDSIITTKRNDLSAYNVNDFSVYRARNSFSRNKQTSSKSKFQRQRSSSFSMQKKSTFFQNNQLSELRKLRKQLSKNKLSVQKLSRKSKQSQRKLTVFKDESIKLKKQNSQLQKSFNQVQQKLKRSQKIRQKQKQMIQQQKQEIQQLKGFLEEVLKRNNDQTLRQSFYKNKEKKNIMLKMLR